MVSLFEGSIGGERGEADEFDDGRDFGDVWDEC